MLTIEIPQKIIELVRIARMGEFPTSCWAAEIISDWLYNVRDALPAEGDGKDPQQNPTTLSICKELGIDHDEFIQTGGDLYRREAEMLLKRALGATPDRPAFLYVSAMVLGPQGMLSDDRKTIELDWDDIMPGYASAGRYPASMGEVLPMPVWQCLMRYHHEQWRDPIGVWHHDVLNWIRLHYEKISYPADQNVPFPATT